MITSLALTHKRGTTWALVWTSDTAGPFRVYRDGTLLASTLATSMDVTISGEDPAVFQVLDGSDLPAESYWSRAILYWYDTTSGVTRYDLEEYLVSVWTKVKQIRADGRGHYTWTTPVLADDTTHQFRVRPYVGDVPGSPFTWTFLMVRRPDPPYVEYEYSAGTGKVTVDDA